jgi:hypothetical protein
MTRLATASTGLQPPAMTLPLRIAMPVLAAILLVGCDVRDEQARGGWSTAWQPTTVQRLTGSPPRASTDPGAAPRFVEHVEGYAAGARRAGDSGLPMLLFFRASWCRWSGSLAAETLADPGLAGSFVAVTVDADRDAATCRSFGVRTFPTVIVLDRERRERFRATGSAVRDGLAAAISAVTTEATRRVATQPAAPSAR